MITRAQAEALLTLAESLEACERIGLSIAADRKGAVVYWGKASIIDTEVTGKQIRKIVIGLCPSE